MSHSKFKINAKLDLVLERVVDVPPEMVWRAWTQPEQVVKWFTPAPWSTVKCEIDLRPGGIFYTVMKSPEGQEFPHMGCYLEVIENKELAWTNMLAPDFRPIDPGFLPFTARIIIEPHGKGTKYTALVFHKDEAGKKQHEEMGFHEGWGAALDQLVAYVKKNS